MFSRWSMIGRAATAAVLFALSAPVGAAPPFVGPNVNMVQGTRWPQGDPFLTKQNEESHAVSSRNPRHLLAGSNDYRLVPVEIAEALDDPEAWVTIYKSVDGGATWRASPLGGCPINIPECNDATGLTAPLKKLAPNFGADPTVRAGPFGTFFVSFIAGTRNTNANGVIAVQRFVDKNNDIQRTSDARPCTPNQSDPGCKLVNDAQGAPVGYFRFKAAEDPILPDVLNIIDTGTPGQGKDKPWNAADVPRSWNKGTCQLLSWTTKPGLGVSPVVETVPAFNVYVSWANFTGQDPTNPHPVVNVAVSSDCGNTFSKPIKLSNSLQQSQGSSIAIDPQTGTVYVAWRSFLPNGIYVSSSSDGGKTWSNKPVQVSGGSSFNAYDQGATGVTFRTLAFPTIAVSVGSDGKSRVHVAWSQRNAAPATSAPYACQSSTVGACDARIVMSTLVVGPGNPTWSAPVQVDSGYSVAVTQPNNGPTSSHSRGHQLQPSMAFAAGKLMITWLDTRYDHTEEVLSCPNGVSAGCTTRREAKGNLVTGCSVDVTRPEFSQVPTSPVDFKTALAQCRAPYMSAASDAVFWPYISDGTPGLTRRHTIDVFGALVDPTTTTTTNFATTSSTRISQYTFGSTVAGTIDPSTGKLTPPDVKTPLDIRQKEVNAPNLPLFANGTGAFIGDYIDVSAQTIVATGDANFPYKWNVGGSPAGNYMSGGLPAVFHVSFTDNRDVIPPKDGIWKTQTCLTSKLAEDAQGNLIPPYITTQPNCAAGFSGNRNQNVYAAVVAENSFATANANAKQLSSTPRAFVVSVRNLSTSDQMYRLSVQTTQKSPAGITPGWTVNAAFDKTLLSGATPSASTDFLDVIVQARSTATRTVWVKSSTPSAPIVVSVGAPSGVQIPPGVSSTSLSQTLVLNGDPNAAGSFVTNGDGGGPTTDLTSDDLGNVVLSNAVLTNNVLTNNALTNAVLTNAALTNAALSNVVLSNSVLSNAVLSNNALTNVVLTNDAVTNNALTNNALSNVVLSNNALNVALTNLDPTNVALSNAALSNNALTNVALSNNALTNNALTNVMLTNAALTNAALTNVALSNAALSNNALTNNALSNNALTNAPLYDLTDTTGTAAKTADSLRTIETGNFEIGNPFTAQELQFSDFRETSFTVRNRGNTDATLAIKLMLRDAVCTPNAGHPTGITDGTGQYTCTPPPGYKLQLILRKIGLTPYAIPPTGPAVDTGRAVQIGLLQREIEISNVGTLPIISPDDPNVGKFLVLDANAATLPLSAGEYAYATVRAIGVGGQQPPDPNDLLRWGVKTVSANSTTAGGPLLIKTLSFPPLSAGSPYEFVATAAATPMFRTFGGTAVNNVLTVTANATCSDKDGNLILQGTDAPTSVTGAIGSFYIHLPSKLVYGPNTTGDSSGWGSVGTPLIGTAGQGDPQTGPKAIKACPPPPSAGATPISIGAFNTQADTSSTATMSFTPRYWGTFYMRAAAFDGSSAAPKDQAVIRVDVQPADPKITVKQGAGGLQTSITYGQTLDLYSLIAPPQGTAQTLVITSNNTAVVFTFAATYSPTNACQLDQDGHTLRVDRTSTVAAGNPSICVFSIHQDGNETYAPQTVQSPSIRVDQAEQVISFGALGDKMYGDPSFTVSATSSSPTAGIASNNPIVFTPSSTSTPGACSTTGTNRTTVNIDNAAPKTSPSTAGCVISANQAGNANYLDAQSVSQTFFISPKPASVTPAAAGKNYGNPDPNLTGALVGFLAADNIVDSYSRTLGEAVASYTISATLSSTSGRPLTNYAITYNTAAFTISKAPTSAALATSRIPSPTGDSITFTATISPTALVANAPGGVVLPSGTVEFFDTFGATTTSLGTSNLAAGAITTTLSTSSLPVGTHTVTAKYSGDANYLNSDAAGIPQVVDTPPEVVSDAYSVLKDNTLAVGAPGVLGDDREVDPGQTVTAYLPVITAPTQGTLALNADGSFSYTPNAGFVGVDSFTYEATDGLIPGQPKTVTITVLDPAATMVAENDAYSVPSSGTDPLLTVTAPGVLVNDNDSGAIAVLEPGGGPLHAKANGFTLNADGSFTYTPTAGYTGRDRFLYRLQAGPNGPTSNLAMVTIAVLPTGTALVAVNDAYIGDQETPLTVPPGNTALLANDPTATGAARVSGPLYGTLTFPGDGSFVYTPIAGFSGMDSFTYVATTGTVAGNNLVTSNLAMATILVRTKTTTTIAAPAVTYPADATVTVTVSASKGTPAGSVSLTVDGGAPVTKALDGTGNSVFTVTGLNGGTHVLSASYAAQGTFSASSGTGQVVVNPAPTMTTVTVSDAGYNGSPDSATAGVTGPGLSETLTVTYTGTGSTSYSSTTAPTNAGTYNASATYAATTNYASSSDTKPFTITKAPQNLAFAAPPSNVVYGAAPFSVNATSTSTPASPSSTDIVFVSTTTNVCTLSAPSYASGTGAVTVTIVGAGTCTMTADQAESTNYTVASQKSITFPVGNAPQVLTFGTAPSGATYGGNAQTITISSSSAPAPWSGVAIALGSGTPTICSISPTSINAATGTAPVTILAAGTCTITANEPATTNYDAATQATQSFSIAAASSTTNLAASPTSASPGADVTLTATVGTTPANPTSATQTVTFKDGNTVIGSPMTLDNSGKAELHTTSLASGQHSITAVFSGDGNVNGSTSAAVIVTIGPGVPKFTATGSMLFERSEHTATKLQDGTVLIVGGYMSGGGQGRMEVEVYCPAGLANPPAHCVGQAGHFVQRASIPKPVVRHTATLLNDGRVLIVGGYMGNPANVGDGNKDYVYTPSQNSWTAVPGNSSAENQWFHTATLLTTGPNPGKVLILGGQLPNGSTSTSAYLFNPATNNVETVNGTLLQRERHTATFDPATGYVWIVGGRYSNSGTYSFNDDIQIYDPASNTLGGNTVNGNSYFLATHRFWHQAAVVGSATQRIILVGGGCNALETAANSSVEVLKATTSGPPASCPVTSLLDLGTARERFTVTSFADGWALAAGGLNNTSNALSSAEFFNPDYDNGPGAQKGKFMPLPTGMTTARNGHTATLLNDGTVLITGGFNGTAITNAAEIFSEQ